MSWLYTPPMRKVPVQMGGALVPKVYASTLVYRQGGVWHNQVQAYIDGPSIPNLDTDPTFGPLFITRPVVVPDSLYAALSAVPIGDPSWLPATLVAVAGSVIYGMGAYGAYTYSPSS